MNSGSRLVLLPQRHISRIRAAIEDDAKKPRRVITVRGAGYVFAKAQD